MSDEFETNSSNDKQQAQPFEQFAVSLEWHVPDNIRNVYADQFIVQARTRDFILSFFDTQVPPFSGNDEQNRIFLESVKSVRAECVGKIIVAPEMVPDIIKALQLTYDRHIASKENKDA